MTTELCIECNEYPRVDGGLYCEKHQWIPPHAPRFGNSSTRIGFENSIQKDDAPKTAAGMARAFSNHVLAGMFRDRESAENAYNSAINRGYTKDDINIMMSDQTRDSWFGDTDAVDDSLGSKSMEGASTGSTIGGTLGAIIGGVSAFGTSVLIPGLGLVVIGPLVAALTGAGAGGLTGGLVGALIGSGIPEDRAVIYEEAIRNGGLVMGVNPRNDEDADYFENEWRSNRGEDIYR